MTENRFEIELEQRLRAVDIPADLQIRLLCLPDESNDISVATSPGDHRRSAHRGRWLVAIAASTLGAASLIGWLAWSASNRVVHDDLVQGPAPPVAESTSGNGSASTAETTDLASLDRQLMALKQEYERLEIAAAEQNNALGGLSRSTEIPFDNDEFLASVIFNTAETCAVSGVKNDAVREHLEYLVKRFERTSSAELARDLLVQF